MKLDPIIEMSLRFAPRAVSIGDMPPQYFMPDVEAWYGALDRAVILEAQFNMDWKPTPENCGSRRVDQRIQKVDRDGYVYLYVCNICDEYVPVAFTTDKIAEKERVWMKSVPLEEQGVMSAPCVGVAGAMWPHMFCADPDTWKKAMNDAKEKGASYYGEAYPNAYSGGNVGPIGTVKKLERDSFVYLYVINLYGDYDSVAFTTQKIAEEA